MYIPTYIPCTCMYVPTYVQYTQYGIVQIHISRLRFTYLFYDVEYVLYCTILLLGTVLTYLKYLLVPYIGMVVLLYMRATDVNKGLCRELFAR